MSMAWRAYRVVAPCLGAIAPAAGMFASPRERALWNERMGMVAVEPGVDAWIHAASMGESLAVAALRRELARVRPVARFHLTATTVTGRGRLAEIDRGVSLAPIDSPQAVRRFFSGLAPRRLFLVETELW